MKNPTIQKAVRVATIAGAAVLVVNSAMSLMKADSPRGYAMPLVSILVGVAAFNYAMRSQTPVVVAQK